MNKLAQMGIEQIFGQVQPPPGVRNFAGGGLAGVPIFITNIVRTIIVFAGLYALFNLLLAGYAFMSAGGDTKQIASAWGKIYQTLLGLAVTAGSFVLAAIFGKILFNDYAALLQFRIFGLQP